MTTTTFDVNIFTPEFITDPFATYEEIRAIGPLVRNEMLSTWMLTGHEDALTVLRDPARFSSGFAPPPDADLPDLLGGAKIMITVDPPEQARLRKVAQAAFLRGSLRRMQDSLAPIVDEVLESDTFTDIARSGGEIDIASTFCRVLPGTVIGRLLGVPTADVDLFVRWADDMSVIVGPGRHLSPDWPEVRARAIESAASFFGYMREQIDRHRAEPHEDLINDLLVANQDGILTDEELLATCFFLLAAGNETTYRLIGSTLLTLGRMPEHRRAMVEDPSRLPGAIEEVMRYEGVNHMLPRRVTTDTVLNGVSLAAEEVVLILTGAANRDPSAFVDADRFVPERSPNPHVGFGHGVHHCLGATLARMEAFTAVTRFLRHIPDYEVGEVSYGPALITRGPEHLVIATDGHTPA
jgi:cytochrome P450